MTLPTPDQLNPQQQEALRHIRAFVSQPPSPGEFQAMRMSGPPGSGKTTTLVLAMRAIAGPALTDPTAVLPPILITAPTNKATRQLRIMLDGVGVRFETTTIYKALGMRLLESGEVQHVTAASENPMASKFNILVVDEYSMINRKVAEELSNVAMRFDLKVIFLGDDDQIPPVKESSSPVSNMVEDFVELTKIERSDAGSPIQRTVHDVRQKIRNQNYAEFHLAANNDPNLGGQYLLTPGDWMNHFKAQAKSCWDSGNMDHSRAIAYTNRRVDFLNDQARKHIHGDKVARFIKGETLIIASPVVDREEGFTIFPTDEEVVVEDVVEGDVFYDEVANTGEWKTWKLAVRQKDSGIIDFLTVLHEDEVQEYHKALEDIKKVCYRDRKMWPQMFYPFKSQFNQVKYPYAITGHRSQGSTYHTVFVDAKNMQQYYGETLHADLYWRLMYVAISRAKFNVAFNSGKL